MKQPRGQSWDSSVCMHTAHDNCREKFIIWNITLYMIILKLSKLVFIFYKHKVYGGIKICKAVVKVSLIYMLSMMSASTVWSYICLNAYSVPCCINQSCCGISFHSTTADEILCLCIQISLDVHHRATPLLLTQNYK